MTDQKRPLTYRDAGVDIDAGNELVKRIAPVAKRTRRPEVLGGLGGFGALCELPSRYKNPVLVAGTDGVGTGMGVPETGGAGTWAGRAAASSAVRCAGSGGLSCVAIGLSSRSSVV